MSLRGRPKRLVPERIVAGGQTGADRAALGWAIAGGVDHGGWCPAGRLAEDGVIPARYHLSEMPGAGYAPCKEANIRDSDATVIFTIKPALGGGSLLTRELAKKLGKPCLHIHADEGVVLAEQRLRDFVRSHGVKVLNAAGPRASSEQGIADFVTAVLDTAFSRR